MRFLLYIQYTMDQLCLPMNLEEDIPENHLVRVVNTAVNRLDDTTFDAVPMSEGKAAVLQLHPLQT
ncbi:transposase [Paenibacillus wynnii]|nr:transposase [Paenibacillus wynnii]